MKHMIAQRPPVSSLSAVAADQRSSWSLCSSWPHQQLIAFPADHAGSSDRLHWHQRLSAITATTTSSNRLVPPPPTALRSLS
mmetsp:Transcript_22851/g.51772  ORF Transcript_22851/g.51772 Transcript_22851/m.51772 type:complete len:82 (+) Transcript_22851:712-957(+)